MLEVIHQTAHCFGHHFRYRPFFARGNRRERFDVFPDRAHAVAGAFAADAFVIPRPCAELFQKLKRPFVNLFVDRIAVLEKSRDHQEWQTEEYALIHGDVTFPCTA